MSVFVGEMRGQALVNMSVSSQVMRGGGFAEYRGNALLLRLIERARLETNGHFSGMQLVRWVSAQAVKVDISKIYILEDVCETYCCSQYCCLGLHGWQHKLQAERGNQELGKQERTKAATGKRPARRARHKRP